MQPQNTNPQIERNVLIGFIVTVVLIISAFGFGVILGGSLNKGGIANNLIGTAQPTTDFDTEYLRSLYQLVKENYLGELPESKEVTFGMAKGMVEALNSEYSAFFTPDEAEDYLNSNDSAYEGIGVQLSYDGEYTTVLAPIAGSPGEQAGLLPGDVILEVNSEDVAGLRPELVSTKIKGPAGTEVILSIYRESETRVIEFTIQRAKIDLKNISFEEVENGVIVINISKFTEGQEGNKSGVEVFNENWSAIVNEVLAKNPSKLVIDLRNNPGGYVESVKYVAEEFLSNDQIIMREQIKDEPEVLYKDNRTGKFETIPVVVLVNQGSASASEILSAAIQDNGRGKVVGEETYGKGVEQKLLQVDSEQSLLLIVFKRWLTAGGRQIDPESPIKPDVEVVYDPDQAAQGTDNQLQEALRVVNL